jgi:ketosteroid isomerase-like protein
MIRAAILALALTWSAASAQAPQSDQTLIRAARQAQNRAIAAQAWDSVASFWLPDVAVVAGLGVTLQGREAYKAGFAADRGMLYERVPGTIQVSEHWPLAYEEGTWTGRATSNPPKALISGRYTAQWAKVRGRWLIRSELFVAISCSGLACQWGIAHDLQ